MSSEEFLVLNGTSYETFSSSFTYAVADIVSSFSSCSFYVLL